MKTVGLVSFICHILKTVQRYCFLLIPANISTKKRGFQKFPNTGRGDRNRGILISPFFLGGYGEVCGSGGVSVDGGCGCMGMWVVGDALIYTIVRFFEFTL